MKKIVIFIILIAFFATKSFTQLDTRSIIYKGRYDIYNKKYQDAIKKFNSVITVKSDLVEPYFFRGIAKYELKDYKGAEMDLLKVINMNPFYVSAYHYIGIVYGSMSDYNLAIKNLDKAIELSPYDASILLSRGITKLQIKDVDAAISDFDKALKYNNQLPEIYLNKGLAYMLKEEYQEAVKQFDKAIKLNVFYADAYARRGISYMEMKQKEEALKDISYAIKLDSKNSVFYYWRAHIYYDNMEFDKAIADYDKVISMNPNNALVYFNRALIKADIGLYNDAIVDYDKVIELNPENIIPYYNKAHIRLDNKEYNKAIKDLNNAIEIFPEFSQAYEMRSYAKSKIGDEKGAYIDKITADKLLKQGVENKIDTNDFKKLVEFDDDFYSTKPRENIFIQQGDIVFTIVKKNNVDKSELKKYYYNFIDDVNSLLSDDYTLILSTKTNNISNDELLKLSKKISEKAIDKDAFVYFIKGIIETELKNYSKAEQNFKLVLLSKKDFAPAQICIANIIRKKQEFENEMANIKVSVEIEGIQSQYGANENKDYSIELIDNYSKIKNKNEIVNYNLGNIYMQENQYYTSIFYYNKAINVNSNLSFAYFNRGLSYIKINQNQKACLDFSKAGELGIVKSYELIEKYCKEK